MAKLKDPQTSHGYELELSNRFTVLQQDLSMEKKWELFSTSVRTSAETVIGRKQDTNKRHWTSDRIWNPIDDRKEAKKIRKKTKAIGITQRSAQQPIAVAQGNRICREIHLPGKCNI